MATDKAIHTVCETIVRLLEQARPADRFVGATFEVFSSARFNDPMTLGVSLFLYHVSINPIQRTLPARPDPRTGKPRRPQLPVDLHFLLTPWAADASTEHELLGWLMRTLEDFPVLGAPILNSVVADAGFQEEESVEIVAGQMAMEEIFRIWDVLPGDFRISLPYVARVVRIDSLHLRGAGIVQVRDLEFGRSEP